MPHIAIIIDGDATANAGPNGEMVFNRPAISVVLRDDEPEMRRPEDIFAWLDLELRTPGLRAIFERARPGKKPLERAFAVLGEAAAHAEGRVWALGRRVKTHATGTPIDLKGMVGL